MDQSLRVALAWLVLQALPLTLSAFRVPLGVGHPRSAESLAVDVLVFWQLGCLAVGSAWLCGSMKRAAVVALLALPALQLANGLALRPPLAAINPMLHVAGWAIVLGVWMAVLRKPRDRSLLAGVATFWLVGLPVLAYARLEFDPTGSNELPWLLRHAPAFAAAEPVFTISLDAITFLIFGVLGLVIRHASRRGPTDAA